VDHVDDLRARDAGRRRHPPGGDVSGGGVGPHVGESFIGWNPGDHDRGFRRNVGRHECCLEKLHQIPSSWVFRCLPMPRTIARAPTHITPPNPPKNTLFPVTGNKHANLPRGGPEPTEKTRISTPHGNCRHLPHNRVEDWRPGEDSNFRPSGSWRGVLPTELRGNRASYK